MANKFNRFLGDMLRGFLDPKGNLGDFQHAARLYVDDTFRLAPKNKFLYYVVFNINPLAINDSSFQDRHGLELNYLVKAVDLPKYTLETENHNQYNRKTVTYKKISYEPINLTLHDDNNGITNLLWGMYYSHYFNDRHNSSDPYNDIEPAAYKKTTYSDKAEFPFRYGMDVKGFDGTSGASVPFFSSIQICTLSRQRFFSYLLCNPKLTKWEHDSVAHAEGNGILENKMTIAYDAVIYNSGLVEVDNPSGFAVLHYDRSPSPIVNEEILQNGMAGIFGDLFGMNNFSTPSTLGSIFGGNNSPYLSTGNPLPFGYGSSTFFGGNNYPSRSGGLQNYGFGNNLATTALVSAGIGLGVGVGSSILKGVFSTNGQKVDMNNASNFGVVTPDNPNGASSSATASPGRDSNTADSTNTTGGNAGDAYGPPAPSYGRRSEAAADAADLQKSNQSTVESAQFNGGETGSRGDRLDGGSTSSLGETQNQTADVNNQLAGISNPYGDQTGQGDGFTAQREADAAASDAGGGSISAAGEPPSTNPYANNDGPLQVNGMDFSLF